MANNNNSINPNLVLAVGALVMVFMGGKKIFEALGLIKSEDDKKAEEAFLAAQSQLANENYFDPDYFQNKPGAIIMTVASANALAKIIYDAKSVINDDEAAVYGVFQSLRTKTQVSFLAYIFFKNYKKSLLSYLLSMFNASEMEALARITNKLPASKP